MAKDRKVRLDPPALNRRALLRGRLSQTPGRLAIQTRPVRQFKGRPKGAQNKRPALNEERRKAIVIDEAYRTIKVSEGRRQIMIPMAQAVTRALAVNTARGQLRSQQMFANLLSEVESANKAPRTSGFERRSNIKSIGSENWSAARS